MKTAGPKNRARVTHARHVDADQMDRLKRQTERRGGAVQADDFPAALPSRNHST
jgi:hypothetical protein